MQRYSSRNSEKNCAGTSRFQAFAPGIIINYKEKTNMNKKLEALQEYLKELGSVAIAFSSGVDSTFLLKVAHDVLGDQVIAVTAQSCSFPKRELEEAKAFCKKEGIKHIICESEELQIEGFSHNPKNRCYLCKHELFEKIGNIAKENNIKYVAEGSNMDDNGDIARGCRQWQNFM